MAEPARKRRTLKDSLHDLERIDGRAGADTIRLWESYRDQAFLWRALALLQMPATMLSIAAALVMFFFADTTIEVPQQPLPGRYSVKQLPDAEFISTANEVVNLIASFQPHRAAEQFEAAREHLWEPALSEFEESILKRELRAITETRRSQVFFSDPKLVRVERSAATDHVVARIPGHRMKLIGNRPLPSDEIVYYIKMTTIPRNAQNEYGIVVTNIKIRKVQKGQIVQEDAAERRGATPVDSSHRSLMNRHVKG